MATAVTSPAQGHCSQCGKIWTLETRQGVCQWCGKLATCQTIGAKPRPEPHRRPGKQKALPAIDDGYSELPEPYYTYYTIARQFSFKALLDERADLLNSIIEGLARIAQHKASQGLEFSEPAMVRTAEHIKDHYWYEHYAYSNGVDCQHCSKAQRAKCRWNWAYSDWAYCDCSRAITLESLNQPVIDSEGNITELGNLIADDKAIDLDEWLDVKTFLIGAPIRLKAIVSKTNKGEALTGAERKYLAKLRKREQLSFSGG